jgi:RNA polymerase sigma-70 factor (ECF subfamily)
LRAYRALPRFRGQSALGTWLHRIAYTAALEQLRTKRRHPEESLPDDVVSRVERVGDPSEQVSERDFVSKALAQLSPQQRLVLLLIDRDGWDYRSVAEMTGSSPGTVCSRLQRARKKIREALTHEPALRSATSQAEES